MIYVEKITVTPTSVRLNPGEDFSGLSAVVSPDNATCKTVKWESLNTSVVVVNEMSGFLHARNVGQTRVIARAIDGSGVTKSISVTVARQPVEDITLNYSSVTLEVGDTRTLVATVSPSNAYNKNINWSSENTGIATVDDNGVVTAISAGSTTITATAADGSGISDYCEITVPFDIKDNVEYHLLCNGDNSKALRIETRNVHQLTEDLPIRGERLSYWNRQKWMVKSFGNEKKLFTQLDSSYYLCNNGSNDTYVSKTATDSNSKIVITRYGNNSDLFEIKLANSNLYLTLVYNSSDGLYWAKWCPKNTSDQSNQVWKFVKQPSNLHNGIDTGSILSENTIQSLKADDTEFIIRYYKMLDTLNGVELYTIGTDSDMNIPKIDATILRLAETGIDLDADNYLGYADNIIITDSNLYTSGNGKSLVTDEKNRYLQHNINIVSVYQNDGSQYEYFTEKHAKLDALSALMSAKLLGQPYGTAIYFAVDYDSQDSELERIKNYFQVIKNKFGNRYKIGVYGSGLVCSTIKPTYANYSWLSQSPGHLGYENYDSTTKYNIKQAEEYNYNGLTVDDDVAVGNDYGQW